MQYVYRVNMFTIMFGILEKKKYKYDPRLYALD